MLMRMRRSSHTAFLCLTGLCFLLCVQTAYGFYVKMENISDKTLLLTCETSGQSKPVTAKTYKKGNPYPLYCNGKDVLYYHSRGDHEKDNHDLFFGSFDTLGDTWVKVDFKNVDGTPYCSMVMRWDSDAYFSISNNKKYTPCTSNYTKKSQEFDYVTVHVYHY